MFLAAMSFVIYAYAIQRVFSREHGVDRRMRRLQVCGTVAAVSHLVALWRSHAGFPAQSASALALYVAGLLVFWAAYRATQNHALSLAFSPDTPRSLVRSGIYARIRHPFYTAYGITWLAGVIQAPSVSTVVSTGVMLTMYVNAARYEEAKFGASALADEYRVYRSQAGMFWPRW